MVASLFMVLALLIFNRGIMKYENAGMQRNLSRIMILLYATGNESKICNMRYRLTGYDVEIITPKDLGIHIDVDESGSTPIENARLKAKAYYEKTGLPTLVADSGLYVDDIPSDA